MQSSVSGFLIIQLLGFMHIIACISILFLFLLYGYHLTVWIYHNISFIHSCANQHLGCFHLCLNSVGMNMLVHIFEYLFSVILGICLGVEFLSHMVILCLTFGRTNSFLPQGLNHYIPKTTHENSHFFHILSHTFLSGSVFVSFIIIPILVGMKGYLTVV